MQNGFELTLKGDNFAGVIAQARALVAEADKLRPPQPATATAARKAKPAAAPAVIEESFLDDVAEAVEETEELPSDDTEVIEQVEEPATKPAKTATAKKLTKNDVDNAAIAHAKKNGRPATMKILATKFKAKSILEIKEANWPLVIKALAV